MSKSKTTKAGTSTPSQLTDVMVQRLRDVLEGQRRLGPASYPPTVERLFELAELPRESALMKKLTGLKGANKQLLQVTAKQKQKPIGYYEGALVFRPEDLHDVIASDRALLWVMSGAKTTSTMMFSEYTLGRRVPEPAEKAFRTALAARLAQRTLPAGIGAVKRKGYWQLFLFADAIGAPTATTNAGGEAASQRTFLYQVLRRLPRTGAVRLRDIVAALREPDNLGIDDADFIIKKAEREKLARRLYAYVEGPAASLFSGGTPLDLDRLTAPTADGRVPLNVIYLNGLTDDDQKHFFLAALASEVYRWMVSSLDTRSGRPNLLFYLDEARDWIPAGSRKPPAKEPLIRLFTQGRKYGVGCLLCTQSPRSVDYNVFGNCSTKIIGRLEAAQDVTRVAEWFTLSGAAPGWIAERKGAERGSFVGRWPDMPPALDGRAFRSRVLYSLHEGAWSPDRVEQVVDESALRKRFG